MAVLDPIQFPFNRDATIQAGAFWLTLYDRYLNWQYLMYLLYLSDRQHLIQNGTPITGDEYFCINGKPNLLYTAELIHGSCPRASWANPLELWTNFFTTPNQAQEIGLLKHPSYAELSNSMIDVILELFETVRLFDLKDLEHWCSLLFECEDLGYPRRIRLYDLLSRNGYELEDLIAVKNNAEKEMYLAKEEN